MNTQLTRRTFGYLCGLFLLSRLVVLAVAALSRTIVLQGPNSNGGRTLIERFAVWDTQWYLRIARAGYYYDPARESAVAFYPLYPMLIRAGTWLGLNAELAGYAISHVALLGACVLLWKLAALETRSAAVAERSVLFLLFCPAAVWFGMIYTESLFLLTVLGCLYCARRGQWLWAGLWGAASALTRTPGLLLAGFLFLEAAQQWLERRRATGEGLEPIGHGWLARAAAGAAGPVLGHAAFLAFLQIRFGDWHAQQKTMAAGWNPEGMRLPWVAFADQWRSNEWFFTAVSTPILAVVVVLAVVGLFSLKRVGYAALVLTLTMLYVSSTTGESLTRYLGTAAPVYIVLAQLARRSRLLETVVLVFSVAALALMTALLINGYRII